MIFVSSLTIDASLLKKLLALWDAYGGTRNPFENILVTPLFASPSTLRVIREELKEKRGANIYFDSGGYYAQQGKISFDDLYMSLRDYYNNPNNQWADYYVLPDNVPTSSDSKDVVEYKVTSTITAVKLFFAEAPNIVKQKAIPVIQGHSVEQIRNCIKAYKSLGLDYFGFGSFGTSGSNSSINIADNRSAGNLNYITAELKKSDIKLHVFGVSTPPVIYAFKKLGVYSFDSLAWQRSAGYGKVYMPYTRAYNVSHRSTKNAALSKSEFEQLKSITNHSCPFCHDFYELGNNRIFRSLHNLSAILDTIHDDELLDNGSIAEVIAWKSEHYYKMFEGVYLG